MSINVNENVDSILGRVDGLRIPTCKTVGHKQVKHNRRIDCFANKGLSYGVDGWACCIIILPAVISVLSCADCHVVPCVLFMTFVHSA